jgi:hypothetical protein
VHKCALCNHNDSSLKRKSKVKEILIDAFKNYVLNVHLYTCICWTFEMNEKKMFVFVVSSGSVTVNPDASVQVLAEEAHPLERIDKEVHHTTPVILYCIVWGPSWSLSYSI